MTGRTNSHSACGSVASERLPLDAFDLAPEEVRSRFDWALREGHPRWLWPEITVEQWKSALEDIERVTRDILLSGCSREALVGRPLAFCIAGYTSGMGPLLGLWLDEGRIAASTEVASVFWLHLDHNSRRMAKMHGHAVEAVERLGRAGVRATVLKGMHTAWAYFPDPGARPLSDIDLLIDPRDRDRAHEALLSLGLEPGVWSASTRQQEWRPAGAPTTPRSLSLAHCDDPWSIDLQLSLNRRYAAGAPLIRLDDIHRAGAGDRWQGSPAGRTLPQPLLAILQACHAGCGLFSLSLVRLVELVLMIRRDLAAGCLDWGDFLAAGRDAGALGICWPALRLSEQLAPGTVPPHVLRACERAAPPQVRRIVTPLTPASGHQVTRWSWAEHFMWSSTPLSKLRLVVEDLLPRQALSNGNLLRTYRQRAWRLAHGTLRRD